MIAFEALKTKLELPGLCESIMRKREFVNLQARPSTRIIAMKIAVIFLVLAGMAFAGERNFDRKVRNFLLLDKKLEIHDAEFVMVKGYSNGDVVDYVFISFRTTHPLEEIIPMSMALEGTELSKNLFRHFLDDIPLVPKLPEGVADQERPIVMVDWYRAPHLYRAWCIGVKEEGGITKFIGLVEADFAPTNGNMPKKLFNQAGKAMSFEEFAHSQDNPAKTKAE